MLQVVRIVALLLAFVVASAAGAATFTVTKVADTADGVCDADCSLREAIIAANAAAGADTVVVPAGTYTLTIPGAGEDAAATGDLDVTDGLTISGAGSGSTTINAGGLDRVLDTHVPSSSGLPVVISGVTLTGGSAGAAGSGGGINHSGSSSLSGITVTDAVITGNSALFGGGIATNNGTTTLTNVTISGNTAASQGGGVRNSSGNMIFTNVTISMNTAATSGGGGINNSSGNLTLVGSSISGNTATGFGGGIQTSSGTYVITDSTIANNTANGATADGGAIFTSSGTWTITNSTFSGNSAGNDGGVFINSSGTWTITNSTFSGNSAGDQGGAFSVEGGTWTLTNVTLSANSAVQGGGLFLDSGTVTLRNTILANAPSENCFQNLGTLTSSGNNLSNDTTCGFALTAPGDLNNTNPQLGLLANNGGPTQTHGLLVGSPAIDAGTAVGAPPTDQRGVARPVGAGFDIGAFEGTLGVAALPTLSIDNVSANEGNAGTTSFTFTVTLSEASIATVTVNFATADGTAVAGSDYIANSGVVTFTPGQTTQPIVVQVVGETAVEGNQTFVVNLSTAVNATIATAQGTGTITNDDAGVVPPVPPTAIPTLSEWALMLLALFLASSTIPSLRRRR